jgi:predicted nucleotidyltransferase
MPRDALTTRKLLAKIDRDIDVYVVLDRFRQAFYDESDYAESLEKRIKILEDAERERVTDTGVQRIIKGELTAREAKVGMRLFWAILSGLGAILLTAVGALISHLTGTK